MTSVSGWRSFHTLQVVRTDGIRLSRVPFAGPAKATPVWVHRLNVLRSYMTRAPSRRMPETPKVTDESRTPVRIIQASALTFESYTMLEEISGHHVTVIGPPPSESFTTSRPFRNSTG